MTTLKRNWSLDSGTTARSFELESWTYVETKDFQLHLLQKADKARPTRPTIPTSELQRLAFIRGYCTAPYKLQIIDYLHQMEYNTVFWLYVFNVLFRSLPMNYLHVFLAAYNPDEHLFGSKMFPLFHGTSWQVIVCAMTQLLYSAEILSIFLYYAVFYVIDESLLAKCDKEWVTLHPEPSIIRCHTIEEFKNISLYYNFGDDKDIVLNGNFYKFNISPKNGTNSTSKPYLFTVPPFYNFMSSPLNLLVWFHILLHILLFRKNALRTNVLEYKSYSWIALYVVIWVAAGMFYKQLYRKYIWKIVHYCQVCMCLIYVATVLYVTLEYLETDVQEYDGFSSQSGFEMAKRLDVDLLGESITGPPIVHLLTARSSDEIHPGRDSFLITISNTFMYFLEGLAHYKLKIYVESKLLAPVQIARSSPFPVFYFWPLFFNNFEIGSSITKLFYFTSFLVEFMIFVVTYQMLLEVLVCEWSWAQRWRWALTLVLSLLGLTLGTCISHMTKLFLYAITTRVTCVTEAILVCWCYPLDRLLDDMYFCNGTAVRKWRKWSLKLLPWYYIFKLYVFGEEVLGMRTQDIDRRERGIKQINIMSNFSGKMWCWAVPVAPLLLGAMFAISKYIIIGKKNWRVLLRPRPTWGPREHVQRQLRKQFNSKEYIGSQALRYLSRHMLAKAQTPSYRLDLRFSTAADDRRRSSMSSMTEDFSRFRKKISK